MTFIERLELLSYISDSYKELNGFRPELPEGLSDDELRQWHNQIRTDLKREMETNRNDEYLHNTAVEKALTPKPFTIGDLFPQLKPCGGN